NIEGQPEYEYNYEVLNHPMIGPQIAAAVVAQSATAVQDAPMRNTVRYTAKATFSTGHELELSSATIGAGGRAAAMDIAQLVGVLTQNPFEEVTLDKLETTIDIDYGLDAYQVMSARLDKTTAAPGETVNILVDLLSIQDKIVQKRMAFVVPDDAPDGDTQIMLADAAQYTQMLLATKPYLNQIDSVDDFVKGLREIYQPEPNKLYAMMPTRRIGLALDGQGLDDLPASKAVLLGNNNPRSQVYQQIHVNENDMGRIVLGGTQLQLKIKRDRGTR
ncbi:MAG: hypothetical protein ACPGYV_12870, partial [Phycisphaeraceae bacterium]